MADSAVILLLQHLSRLLDDELNLLSGVKNKTNSLWKELKFINIFLKNSADKRNNEFVKELVNQIRDVAFRIEDLVDIYIASVAKHSTRNKVSKLFHLKQVMVLHEVNDEIGKIKEHIEEIYNNRERYDITKDESAIEDVAAESLRQRRREVEEKDVVGLVHDSNFVIKKLMEEGDLGRKVVSIIGMGGLGKTTLARKVYNNDKVKKLFPTRAWGYVSNDYRPKELLLSLLRCLKSSTSEYEDLSGEELKKKVGECLKGKKYLVVLDDIWKIEEWNKIENVFPNDNDTAGTILITSREKEVANYVGTTSPYHLPFLNKEESWQLFSKKVFRGKECPSDLKPLGRSIAESCKGLPLAIVVLAGLVAKKEITQREWFRIKKITWHLTQDKMEAMDILKLSYDSLPQRLKPCFLHFGIYPEDYEISAREVIEMWIAEGFIQPHEAGISSAAEPEDIAEYYLDELVDRSLVQVARRKRNGGVKTCRIHDLLRDLCISESKSDKFMEVCTEPNNMDALCHANPRRLSFHCNVESIVSTNNLNRLCSRSLFFFSQKVECPKDVLKRFKLARVIYSTSKMPLINWKKTIHLRYLRINASDMDIPASVCNLLNLETLDARSIDTVSNEIWKLKRLKHLYIWNARKVAVLPKSQRKIKGNLETLLLTSYDGQGMFALLNKDIFPKLRKLVLKCTSSSFGEQLPSLCHLSNLQILKIIGIQVHLSSDANMFPTNLTKITLKDIFVKNALLFLKNIKTLGLLANLQILKLIKIYAGVSFDINFGDGEFPQLKLLHVRELSVKRWTLEKSAMSCLQNLVIYSCLDLHEIPEQLWSFTTLQEVHVGKPSERLSQSLRNVELKNGCKLIISSAP